MIQDTKASKIDLPVANSNLLLKTNCRVCEKVFSNNDIEKVNYQFVVNYGNQGCFTEPRNNNEILTNGQEYFLSLKICGVEHKKC